jgi:hypothetical protein
MKLTILKVKVGTLLLRLIAINQQKEELFKIPTFCFSVNLIRGDF